MRREQPSLQLSPQKVRYAGFVILLVAFTAVLFLAAPLVWSVLQLLIIVSLLSLALETPVGWLVQRRVPRWSAVVFIMLLALLVVGIAVYFLIPPLMLQAQAFMTLLPRTWAQVGEQTGRYLHRFPEVERALDLQYAWRFFVPGDRGALFGVVRGVFASAIGGVASVILTTVMTFYILLDPWPVVYGLRGLFPMEWWTTLDRIATAAAVRLRAWVVGIFLLATIVGAMDYLALLLINAFSPRDIPFILLFAIIGAVLELIPIIGPIMAAIIPALVGFAIDPVLGLLVLGAFTLVQQIENNLLAPVVMHTVIKLHPVSLIVAIVLLTGLFGFFGAVIAVPTAAVLKVLYDEWYYPLVHHGREPQAPPTDAEVLPEVDVDGSAHGE